MEQRRNLILTGTETFSKGGLDNVALENGSIVLDGAAGRHMPFGCYTTPEFALPPFCNLNVSWNADTPDKTVIEAQCRVRAGGAWTGGMCFGKWSPAYPRKSPGGSAAGQDKMVFCSGDTITVAVPGGGSAVQLRMNLYSDDEKCTPAVRLLAVAARPLAWEKLDGSPVNRTLFLPEYSMHQHDYTFGQSMDLPLVLAGMMNRYGEDVLPEELAYGMSDGATALCRNAAYAAAMAGSCGFRCWQAWADVSDLRAEVRAGYSVAVELENRAGREISTRWMGLHGFCHETSPAADAALLHDPAAAPGEGALRLPLTEFRRLFTGRARLLRPRIRGTQRIWPRRTGCSLKPGAAPGEYLFERRGELWPLPENFGGWLAAAPHDGVAHATTAARTFLRLQGSAAGGICLPPEYITPGARYSIYAVDETGSLRVAELRLPGTPPAPPAAEEPANRKP